MDWPNTLQSSSPAKYRFRLVTETEDIVCNPEPLEWATGSLMYKRDLDCGGVFSSFQMESLIFIGSGAELLRKLFDAYEVNAKCTLVVEYWRFTERNYTEFPTRFDINFNFFQNAKVGKYRFGVKVKAVNNSSQTKLDNRIDTVVDIRKLVSIGEVPIEGFGYADSNLDKKLSFGQININYLASLGDKTGSYFLTHIDNITTYTSIPMTLNYSQSGMDFSEVKSVPYITAKSSLKGMPAFFEVSKSNRTLTIYYDFDMGVSNRYVGSFPWNIKIIETNPDYSIANETFIAGFGGVVKTYHIYGEVSINVSKGNSLMFIVECLGFNATYRGWIDYSSVAIREEVVNNSAAVAEGFPLYEALQRVSQHVLDVQFPIYSDFFGRVGIPYNENGGSYGVEDTKRFAHLLLGINLRGILLDDPNATFGISFKKLFQCIKAIWNVGYSLQSIGDDLRIRIEEYAFFFQNTEIVFDPPISQRINKYDIDSVYMPELVPLEIKSGFSDYEYLSVNGRGESNTENNRTTIMNTSTKLENISPYRADTKGIYDNIANQVSESDGSKDTKGDGSVFIIKTQVEPAGGWKPEKAELITVDSSSSLFKDDLLNRYFTPTRMLKRHGNRITAGLTKFPASKLTFQTSEKWSSLITTGEGYTIAENEDILVSDLADPIYKAMKHTITCDFTIADLDILTYNPFGYITFGQGLDGKVISGYLLSLKKKNNEDKAEITIIEKYIP